MLKLQVNGNVAQLDNVLVINTSPVWNTATGTLATINDTATGTHATVNATDADGQTITYSEIHLFYLDLVYP